MHTEMWEHPATQANVATLRARGVGRARPGRRPADRRRHRPGPAARARGDRSPPPCALLRRTGRRCRTSPGRRGGRPRRRHPRAARPGAVPGQPVLRPAGRRAGRGRRRPGRPGHAGRREHRAPGARRASTSSRSRPAEELREPCAPPPPAADVVVMAAAVADFRPGRGGRAQDQEDATTPRRSPVLELVAQPRHPRRARRPARPVARPARSIVGFAAETGDDDGRRARPRPGQAAPQGLRPARGQRRVGADAVFGSDRNAVTHPRRAGGEPRRVPAGTRPPSPTPSGTPCASCGHPRRAPPE